MGPGAFRRSLRAPRVSAESGSGGPLLELKRVYALRAPDDGLRVLVDRLWPRGLTRRAARIDYWAKDVAPSSSLRRWFGHDPQKWAEFVRRYRAELAAAPQAIAGLIDVVGRRKATLLYAAKDPQVNHGLVLIEHLRDRARAMSMSTTVASTKSSGH